VVPHWFKLLAWVALALGSASALVVAGDIVVLGNLGNRQHMGIMSLVFPLSALYMGPVAGRTSPAAGGCRT
jgi:hypothetical protein